MNKARPRFVVLAALAAAAIAVISVSVFFATRYQGKAEAFFDAGMAYYEEDSYDSAAAYFDSAIEQNPRKAKYHYRRGRALHQKKDYTEAIAAYTEALRLEPDNAKAYAHRGGAYYDRFEGDDNLNALEDFYRSIDLNPNYTVKLPELDRPLKIPAARPVKKNDKTSKLLLDIIVTDSAIRFGLRGGFTPSTSYWEFHRYVTADGLDTLIRYEPGKPARQRSFSKGSQLVTVEDRRPVNPHTGRAFTEDERVDIHLYATYYASRDEPDAIARVMYTKSGKLLTAHRYDYSPYREYENRLKSVSAGDTVVYVEGKIIVSDTNDFERRPLSAYDEFMDLLMYLKVGFRYAEDADDIVISIDTEGGIDPDKVMKAIYAARIAGYPNIDLAKGNDDSVWGGTERVRRLRRSENSGGKEAGGKPAPAARAPDTAAAAPEEQADIKIDMVFVNGGTFFMGCTEEQGTFFEKSGTLDKCTGNEEHDKYYCDCDDDEKPAHKVTLGGFYLGKYEVTQGQWAAVMDSRPFSQYGVGDDYPVYNVDYNDVQEFIRKLNAKTGKRYRLPTEAEWEYAARGGKKSRGYKYSGHHYVGYYLYKAAWYSSIYSYDFPNPTGANPVGVKQANELGLYDMSGNVFEWVADWYGGYDSVAQTNPAGPEEGAYRVYRGGSWRGGQSSCRVSYRVSAYTGYRQSGLGFRLALDP